MKVVPYNPITNENKNELINIGLDIEKIMEEEKEDYYVIDIFKRYSNVSRIFLQTEKENIDQNNLKRDLENLKLELWKNAAIKKYNSLEIPINRFSLFLKWISSKDFRDKKKKLDRLASKITEVGSGFDKKDYIEKYRDLYQTSKTIDEMKMDPQTLALIISVLGIVLVIIFNERISNFLITLLK